MRCSDMAIILFLLSGLVPVAASAQQIAPDPNQATQARSGQQQQPEQAQNQGNPAQPGRTQQQSGQAQTQNSQVEPSHTPQQTDQLREQERRSAQDTRINRDWTAQQQTEERQRQAEQRQQQAEERMYLDRMRQHRMMEENEDHQTTGRNGRVGDDEMYRSPRYGSADRDRRYYYEARPRPRVKTCIEYENGDEFCRYRD
jgi:hypothetical protein